TWHIWTATSLASHVSCYRECTVGPPMEGHLQCNYFTFTCGNLRETQRTLDCFRTRITEEGFLELPRCNLSEDLGKISGSGNVVDVGGGVDKTIDLSFGSFCHTWMHMTGIDHRNTCKTVEIGMPIRTVYLCR